MGNFNEAESREEVREELKEEESRGQDGKEAWFAQVMIESSMSRERRERRSTKRWEGQHGAGKGMAIFWRQRQRKLSKEFTQTLNLELSIEV